MAIKAYYDSSVEVFVADEPLEASFSSSSAQKGFMVPEECKNLIYLFSKGSPSMNGLL